MNEINQTIERKQLAELADKYRQQGYEVLFPPDYEELPDFISIYTPDLVVRNQNETVVLQIQNNSPTHFATTQYLSHLAKEIEKYPNWKLVLKAGNLDNIKLKDSLKAQEYLQIDDIKTRFQDVNKLAKEYPEAAILICYSLIEATVRLLTEKEHLSLKEFDFRHLIKELVFNGVISQSQYSALQKAVQLRNAIAHGFKTDSINYDYVQQLIQLQQELLIELGND